MDWVPGFTRQAGQANGAFESSWSRAVFWFNVQDQGNSLFNGIHFSWADLADLFQKSLMAQSPYLKTVDG